MSEPPTKKQKTGRVVKSMGQGATKITHRFWDRTRADTYWLSMLLDCQKRIPLLKCPVKWRCEIWSIYFFFEYCNLAWWLEISQDVSLVAFPSNGKKRPQTTKSNTFFNRHWVIRCGASLLESSGVQVVPTEAIDTWLLFWWGMGAQSL